MKTHEPKTPKPTMPASERTVRVLYDYLQKVANSAARRQESP